MDDQENHRGHHQTPDKGEQDGPPGDWPQVKEQSVKGKEREPSMFDRLRSSAKGASATMSSGNAGLHRMPPSSEKATATGSGLSSRDTAGILQETSLSRPSLGTGPRDVDSFRKPREPDSSSRAFDEFSSNGQEPLLTPEPTRPMTSDRTMAGFEATDGSAVVDLLSQPPQLDEMLVQDGQGERLTPAAAAKLREALFGSSESSRLLWDDILNFTPRFATRGAEAEEARVQLGTTDLETAREIWLGQWRDVLSAYTDEVWGDLGPLAAEARKELSDFDCRGEKDGAGDGALGRLRMILAHIRGAG